MNLGLLFDVKVWRLHKDHWQFGFVFETGQLFTDIPQQTEVYRNDELTTVHNTYYRNDEVLSPNVVPALFVHYQQNFGEKFCLHGGVMGGMMIGLSDVVPAKNITAPIGGLDLALAFAISKNVKMQFENGLRMTRIGSLNSLSRTTGDVSSGNYAVHRVKAFTTTYLVHAVSLLVKI